MKPIKPEKLISCLWIFILFNITFRDFHQFASPGFIQGMIEGQVNGIKLTDELALIGGFLIQVPILMILLSLILNNSWNKWLNIFSGVLTLGVFATALPYADIDDIFHFIFELAAICWIFVLAWKLPKEGFQSGSLG